MTDDDPANANSRRRRLAKALGDPAYRHGYMARKLRGFLALQIRALRGDMKQADFGDKIGQKQSVVSRLEKQLGKGVSIQTLIDIAAKLDIAVLIKFVDYGTFLRETEDMSDAALVPGAYSEMTLLESSPRISSPDPRPTEVRELLEEGRSFDAQPWKRFESEFASVN